MSHYFLSLLYHLLSSTCSTMKEKNMRKRQVETLRLAPHTLQTRRHSRCKPEHVSQRAANAERAVEAAVGEEDAYCGLNNPRKSTSLMRLLLPPDRQDRILIKVRINRCLHTNVLLGV